MSKINTPLHSEPFIRCPRCERPDLTEKDFGICRARVSGRNLYCFRCIREKVYASRQALREYKAAHRNSAKKIDQQITYRRIVRSLRSRRFSPMDQVRQSIQLGNSTQEEIVRVTKLPRDEVSDCVAELMLDRREIRTEERGGVRMYFVVDKDLPVRKPNVRSPHEPSSYGVSNIYSCGEFAA